jgi:1,4-alpha-glucan branching enzyme
MSELQRLQAGTHHDPFHFLGWHQQGSNWIFRAFMPSAEQIEVNDEPMQRLEGSDCFTFTAQANSDLGKAAPHTHPTLRYLDKKTGQWLETITPYTFTPQLGDIDLHLLGEGNHRQAWKVLGAHLKQVDGVDGCLFAVWAPGVQRVSVVGNFNDWDGRRYPMRSRGETGIWELFIPSLPAGEGYKYELLTRFGSIIRKTDPYAQQMFLRPETASCITAVSQHAWQDQAWIQQREQFDWQHQAVSIYELHAGSWRRHPDNRFYNWRELADSLIPYVKNLGYTHIELLPISEHPLDQSWGYQVSGYYAPTARLGSPDDLRHFVDLCHQNQIGILLDWVPAHFPKDDFALARFNGDHLYEHADPRKGEHQDWGTLIFDYGRNEVRNFLIANALYWMEEFHIDGLRVDAVASMLYLDYSRPAGQWLPNQYGGRENIEAVAFLRELNLVVHSHFPGVLTVAEESTTWPSVSRPIEMGGLGFSMKWNMGWMNDSLSYIELDPIYRKYHHNKLTFSQMYAWTENFVLPLSHDEVVHMKHSMLGKMPGDYWQKFANLRLFYAWHYAHPGKKLLFMGGEFGQWLEWNEAVELDWGLLEFPAHQALSKLIADLNQLYRTHPALHQFDHDPQGFRWIDCNDASQSLLSLLRYSSDREQPLVIALNFTPVLREGYRLGVPDAADYEVILNTDSQYYGGSNCGNSGLLSVQNQPCMGFEHSIEITLPPLAAVFLQAIPKAHQPLIELTSDEID